MNLISVRVRALGRFGFYFGWGRARADGTGPRTTAREFVGAL